MALLHSYSQPMHIYTPNTGDHFACFQLAKLRQSLLQFSFSFVTADKVFLSFYNCSPIYFACCIKIHTLSEYCCALCECNYHDECRVLRCKWACGKHLQNHQESKSGDNHQRSEKLTRIPNPSPFSDF